MVFVTVLFQILAGSGDMKAVRLWDCRTEMKLTDFPSGTDSFVTRQVIRNLWPLINKYTNF